MAAPEFSLDSDGKALTVTFPTNPPVSLKLSTADVDATLKSLGALRSQMQPEIPDATPDYADEDVVVDPVWETAPDDAQQNALLHLCDPRFGWLHYAIPAEEAQKLAGFLQP